MSKILKNITLIISTIVGIITIISFVIQTKNNDPRIEVLEINNENLTNLPAIKNLQSEFYYKDSLITNLWKLNASVKNIGSKTIIGKGSQKNIIGNNLTFKLNSGFKLIDFNISKNDFPYEKKILNGNIKLSFSQWRKDEKLNITIYAEQVNNNSNDKLEIILNEREIIDGKINYSKSNQLNENKPKRLIYYLPPIISKILFGIGIVFYGVFLFFLPYFIYTEISKHLSFRKWQKEYQDTFKYKISELFMKNEIDEEYTLENAPYNVWIKTKIPYHNKPTNSILNLFFVSLLTFILTIIPILWMIKM